MDLDLAGKRVLITGASKGIGLACAMAFAAEGAHPILVGRTEQDLQRACNAIKDRFGIPPEYIAADLSKSEGVWRVAEVVKDIDVLVNNAGSIPGGQLDAVSDERLREAWELKLFGYINLIRAYLPRMKEQGRGVIANVIGIAGVSPKADYFAGSAANAALIALTQALGGEAPRHGVRMFGVNPGQTRTERTESLSRQRAATLLGSADRWTELLRGLPFGRLIEPEEVANLVVFGCSDRVGYLSASVIDLDGGLRYAPKVG